MDEKRTYLGIELSTQTLKIVQLNSSYQYIAEAEVKFDTDLPEFKTKGGFNTASNNAYYYVRPIMIIKAVDSVLKKLLSKGVKLNSVVGICGSVQQHGFVLWTKNGTDNLKNADARKTLSEQLHRGFVMDSLIWSDDQVVLQCEDMEKVVGGRENMWKITGTKAYPQFTGPQIRKLFQIRQDVYEKTEKITIFSSFLASLFIGDIAPVEYTDASSMNLFDIKEKKWSPECLQACAPDLKKKIGIPVAPCSIIGTVSKYLRDKYGFSINCKVASFTGDAASTFTGYLTVKDWLILSLGKRDTLMVNVDSIPDSAQLDTQIMCHPTSENNFIGLVSFKNGDLARNYIMRTEANNDWDTFNALLDNTAPGNNGFMAIHNFENETSPRARNTLKWNNKHNKQDKDSRKGLRRFTSSEIEIRALMEGQIMHRRIVAENLGFDFNENTKVLVIGINPDNKAVLKVIADIFSAPVYMMNTEYSTVNGNIYRAKYALHLHNLKSAHPDQHPVSHPDPHPVSHPVSHPVAHPFAHPVSHPVSHTVPHLAPHLVPHPVAHPHHTHRPKHEELPSFEEYIISHIEDKKLHVCNPRENSFEIYRPMLERSRDMIEILRRRADSIDTEF